MLLETRNKVSHRTTTLNQEDTPILTVLRAVALLHWLKRKGAEDVVLRQS